MNYEHHSSTSRTCACGLEYWARIALLVCACPRRPSSTTPPSIQLLSHRLELVSISKLSWTCFDPHSLII
ncbi:hypothetical protein VTL71DRAFT_4187 [Oculimacula yallundae]|uniref:Uncharacterized protein n=1 Tax=Oculimacula yallundae TaxID=86028 RepID=A0ABR4C526_9HELO